MGCHFLLQCMKVKSESEVAQSCPTLSDPMDCSLPGSSIHGIFQARVLEWGAIAFSQRHHTHIQIHLNTYRTYCCYTSLQKISIKSQKFIKVVIQMPSSVQFSRSVVSDSLRPHELQHARPHCPSPTPGIYTNSCPSPTPGIYTNSCPSSQ